MAGARIKLVPPGAVAEVVAYSNVPSGARRGMVVIHEMLGLQPEIERVVDRFAGHGYAAVAPALFTSPFSLSCIRAAIALTTTGQGPFAEVLKASRTFLVQSAGIAEAQVGLIGFCLGGGFALAAGAGWGAVSTNYGDIPKAELTKGIGPVIGCYGGRDRVFGKSGPKLEAALKPLGVEVETYTYPGVGHSFLTDGHHPIAYALSASLFHITWNKELADEAWGHILAFMDRHLQPPAAA